MELRSRLNLVQNIDELCKNELQIELEKRDIQQYVKQASWEEKWDDNIITAVITERLEQYLKNEKCRKMYDLLVIGYCKKIENDNAMNIPSVDNLMHYLNHDFSLTYINNCNFYLHVLFNNKWGGRATRG